MMIREQVLVLILAGIASLAVAVACGSDEPAPPALGVGSITLPPTLSRSTPQGPAATSPGTLPASEQSPRPTGVIKRPGATPNPLFLESWAREFSTGSAAVVVDMALGPQGIVYVIGSTQGDALGQAALGAGDAFLRSYDADGEERWTRQFGSVVEDTALAVAAGPNGEVYVTGLTDGNLSGQQALGRGDAFVVRYDSDGNLEWARQFGSGRIDIALAVAVGPEGEAYVAGSTGGAIPGQESEGRADAFVLRYDADGSLAWGRQFGSPDRDTAAALAVGPQGEVYVVGDTGGALPEQTSFGSVDAYISRYSGDGRLVWARQFGTGAPDGALGVAVDSAGAVYVSGATNGALSGQTATGSLDAYLRKHDSDGKELWTRQFGTVAPDVALSVSAGPNGQVYVSGFTSGALPGQEPLGGIDGFVQRFDGDGNVVWASQLGSPDSDAVEVVAVDPKGPVYFAGWTGDIQTDQDGAGRTVNIFVQRYN